MKKYIFIFVAIVLLGVSIPLLNQLRAEGLTAGKTAPDFTLPKLLGEGSVTLQDLRGQVVLVNFWSAVCPPCREEKPHMQRVYDDLNEQGFTILAVNVIDAPGMARAYIEEYGYTFPVVKDDDSVRMLYEVNGWPTSFLLDRDGVIQHVKFGAFTENELRNLVEDWL